MGRAMLRSEIRERAEDAGFPFPVLLDAVLQSCKKFGLFFLSPDVIAHFPILCESHEARAVDGAQHLTEVPLCFRNGNGRSR